ncbi:MAG: FUSC family protein [Simkaniaceae bacterium]|nr:MAG: FUSC family protein [Simkaniaceae bacterium]
MTSIKGNVVYALQLSIVSGVSYFLGYFLSGFTLPTVAEVGGLWSVISGVLVIKQHQSESYSAGFGRLLGTLVGCVVSAICLYIPEMIFALLLNIFITSLICTSIPKLKELNFQACITSAVIIIIWQLGSKNNEWLFSFSRFIESVAGVSVAIAVANTSRIWKKIKRS